MHSLRGPIAGLAAVAALTGVAFADYDSHPDLRPDVRCADIPPTVRAKPSGWPESAPGVDVLEWTDAGTGDEYFTDVVVLRDTTGAIKHATIEDPINSGTFRLVTAADIVERYDEGGTASLHCQRLVWDIAPTTEPGAIRVAAPFHADPVPRFPEGLTDRPPPIFVADEDGEPGLEGYERQNAGKTRQRLCPVGEIGYWKELLNEAENTPVEGCVGDEVDGVTVGPAGLKDAADPSKPQCGPLFRLTCTRGTRAYMGPWQTGTDQAEFDRLTAEQWIRFESTAHIDADEAADLLPTHDDGYPMRVEWNVASEFYNHFSSHHGTCYLPNTNGTDWDGCNNPADPVEEPGNENATGACADYQAAASPGGGCYSEDHDPACNGAVVGNGGFRNGTQVPGRLSVTVPTGFGAPTIEDQIWRCNHHVVLQLPPASYPGQTRLANYRLQRAGIVNQTGRPIYDTPDGEPFGGAVGEVVINHLTIPWLDSPGGDTSRRTLNTMFNAAPDLLTTYYPPFTWNYHTTLWFPPFDAAITTASIHSHHRMVKGTMDLLPANPLRPNSPDPACGGSRFGNAQHLYENWNWEEAHVCQYWRDPDGPVTIRKGQAIATTCFVNNGVTPEAIKQGLVAADTVAELQERGAPIPDYPALVPASTWGEPLQQSPVGDQLLYGQHPPVNYRVVYKCAPDGLGSSLLRNNPISYFIGGTKPCSPNPETDDHGDYVDGPYRNAEQCGWENEAEGLGKWCEPSSIIFRCVGEDEMCIGVAAYYELPRLGSDRHDEAVENLQNGDLENVGTPGATTNTDLVGVCPDCPQVVGP